MSDESPTTANPEVRIKSAMGRPMLSWVGKRPLTRLQSFPAQHIETFDPSGWLNDLPGQAWNDWPTDISLGGVLFHGDNREVLAHLLAHGFRGKVNFVYIDPPFNTGVDNYVRRVRLRGAAGARLEGEAMSLVEQVQYANSFAPDLFLQLMYERLILLKEILDGNGVLAMRIDYRYAHHLKLVLDEVFGSDNFVNEVLVARQRETAGSRRKLDVTTESIFIYSRSSDFTFNKVQVARSVADIAWTGFLMAGERRPRERTFMGLTLTPPAGQHYPLKQEKVDQLVQEHFIRLRCRNCGALHFYGTDLRSLDRSMKRRGERFKFYDVTATTEYFAVQAMTKCQSCKQESFSVEYLGSDSESVTANWTDIPSYSQRTGYPTENSEELLDRLIRMYSEENDIVLDCFMGSGTTAAVAQKLNRRWIGCDINKGSIQTTSKRLQDIIVGQLGNSPRQFTLLEELPSSPLSPAFTTWRVNDYDLQIQHNEAVNLACEHIGIQRITTDPYFDGTLGADVVKIVPFNHPLSPADLEELRTELEARPDEDRSITLVCLGMELAAQAWVNDWNQLRRGKNAINRVNVIELRTDDRYGDFIQHEPCSAKVSFQRGKDGTSLIIEDFVSPTILARLAQQAGVLAPQIDDWRAMVDSVMLDTDYNGEVFNIAVADVPARRQDLVQGHYKFDSVNSSATIAVKIIDMLGEELLVTDQGR